MSGELALYAREAGGRAVRLSGASDPALTGARFTTGEGGFASGDFRIAGDPDLPVLTDLVLRGGDGEIAWEGRIESAPVSEGVTTIEAAGWQAALADDPQPFLGVDSDPASWGEPSLERFEYLTVPLNNHFTAESERGLRIELESDKQVPAQSRGELHYLTAGGVRIGALQYRAQSQNTASTVQEYAASDNLDFSAPVETGALTADNTIRTVSLASARAHLLVRSYTTAAVTKGTPHRLTADLIAVFGDHGLPRVALGNGMSGLLASDVVRHIAGRTGVLQTARAGIETIAPTSFGIPQLAFAERTEGAEIIGEALSYHADRDWFVYDERTVHCQSRETFGRTWRLDSAALVTDSGPQAADAYNGVFVSFEDRDGRTLTAGPPGSGADTEDASLSDPDPGNPVNLSPLTAARYLPVDLERSNSADAIAAGQIALADALRRKVRGDVEIPAAVRTESGIELPSWAMRAGDKVIFGTDTDSPEGLVIETEYEDGRERPQRVTLDDEANRLDAFLARKGAARSPRRRRRKRPKRRQRDQRVR